MSTSTNITIPRNITLKGKDKVLTIPIRIEKSALESLCQVMTVSPPNMTHYLQMHSEGEFFFSSCNLNVDRYQQDVHLADAFCNNVTLPELQRLSTVHLLYE